MARSPFPLLTQAELNRATLARQLLLEHDAMDVVAAVERIGGLQAQEPASPYIALQARIAGFEAGALDAAFRDGRVVKATLMRMTVHAVSRDDYLHMLPALQPMLRAARRGRLADAPSSEVDGLANAALAFASVPRTNVEMRDHVAALAGEGGDDAWWRVRRHAPFVHVPDDVPWSFGRRPVLMGAPSAVGGEFASEPAAVRHLVLRHLRAFGPATLADIGNWSGLPVTRLRAAIVELDVEDCLRRFSDERGRELLDVHDGPLPGADVPALPRLLPMWDSVLLAHADRSRIVPEEYQARVVMRNGDVLPTFLVDGRVAGLWWAKVDAGRTRIRLEPFASIPRAVLRDLEELGERFAAFVEPHEPVVYSRYRWDRSRAGPRPASR